MTWSDALPFFSKAELQCKGSDLLLLHDSFAAHLPALRARWGPIRVTSACRSREHNKAVGGHPRSLHLTHNDHYQIVGTLAADIWWSDWEPMAQLDFARLAHDAGWSVGLNRTFVHVDRRIDIGLRSRVFAYKNWRGYFSAQDIEDFV